MRLTEFLEGFLALYDDKNLPANDALAALVLAGVGTARYRAAICTSLCDFEENVQRSTQQVPAFNSIVVRLPHGETVSITDKSKARMLIRRDAFGKERAAWIDGNYLYLYNHGGSEAEVYGYWVTPIEVRGWVGCGRAVTDDDIEVEVNAEQIGAIYERAAYLLRKLQAATAEDRQPGAAAPQKAGGQ